MDRPLTPEHLQLFSDKKLSATAEPDRPPASDDDRALVRMARYESYRRRCEVPVRDRYEHV